MAENSATKINLSGTTEGFLDDFQIKKDENIIDVLDEQEVILLDWWLTKVKVQVPNPLFKLGVAGDAYNRRSVAYFSSSEIVKRHIEGTLETADGITIILMGPINRPRTYENGFPSQVYSHFAIGFPFDWEHIGAQYFGGESIDRGRLSVVTSMSNNDANRSPALASKDLPVTRYFDRMMHSSGDYNECTQIKTLFDDILSEYGNDKDNQQIRTDDPLPNECGTPLNASKENNRPVVSKSSPLHKAPIDCLTNKDVSNGLDAMPMVTDDDVHKLSECVFTRPKTRSEASRNNQVEGLSLNTSMPRTSTKKHSCGINKTDASNVIQSAIQNADCNEVGGILDSSRVRNFRGSGVLTRSRARLLRQIIDPESAIQNADSNEVGGILDSSRVRNSRGSVVLTRSRARLLRQIIDPEHNVAMNRKRAPNKEPTVKKTPAETTIGEPEPKMKKRETKKISKLAS